ncbi:His-Xaa-Ser system-associated MauG-like protein [Pseudoalteromonas sp. OOF1S-7]|uniref:His-Xaa-Ser system-associated MauG-like protein n=1 Tax=Pseudoalteromonas sp. OOF1S-7 TaxID=2917757 RepID=UPI001EF64CB2|nr:His-Xaa-Ser system-associated MauG-like protein [Pseudoalteromonas sp. OOF1S-7]MCG7535815.1 His-Xaa-Ser system-associated MauG-like protein [Pseudoalteromonas sp. OOF1S-7]
MKLLPYFLLVMLSSAPKAATDIDFKLAKVIEAYNLRGLDCSNVQSHEPSLSELGKFVFESTLLSGNNDTSCSTCHIESKARTDGLSVSVGVGGSGEGMERFKHGHGILVPRNSFTLMGRGFADYQAYFWDGKVQSQGQDWVTPVGDGKKLGYHSLLAVSATLPLLARDEFLGLKHDKDSKSYVSQIDSKYHGERFHAATYAIREKLVSRPSGEWQKFKALLAQNKITESTFQLSDLGNAIAAFIIRNENCVSTRWSNYIKGDKSTLTSQEKEGAFLFYGKGRCATCHSGDLFSDFSFHSLAVPQGTVGVSMLGQDLGRSEISLNVSDRYKFKTPSLLKVSETAPYGHNGVFQTLSEIVEFHLNPIIFLSGYQWADNEKYNYGRLLSTRSPLLSHTGMLTKDEVDKLLQFLTAI